MLVGLTRSSGRGSGSTPTSHISASKLNSFSSYFWASAMSSSLSVKASLASAPLASWRSMAANGVFAKHSQRVHDCMQHTKIYGCNPSDLTNFNILLPKKYTRILQPPAGRWVQPGVPPSACERPPRPRMCTLGSPMCIGDGCTRLDRSSVGWLGVLPDLDSLRIQ